MSRDAQLSLRLGGRLRERLRAFIFAVPEPGARPRPLVPREKLPAWVPGWMTEAWFFSIVILALAITVGDHPIVRVISWWLMFALTGYLLVFRKVRNAFLMFAFILAAALVGNWSVQTARGLFGG